MPKTKRSDTTENAPPPEKWTAGRVLALLEARHPRERGEWAFFTELRSHTGYSSPGRESYMDAFAMACWPSSGFTRVAYEVKVSRQDFLHELQDPTKRAKALSLSNEMWFAAPSGVIREHETPDDCGWLEVTAGGLRIRKAAPHRQVQEPPMAFIASLLRWSSQARDGHGEGLSLRQAKAFKFAGREMTVDDMLSVASEEMEKYVESQADRRAEDKAKTLIRATPHYALAKHVATIMGRRSYGESLDDWGIPRPKEFAMWLEGLQLGGMEPRAVENLKNAISVAEDLAVRLARVKAALEPKKPEANPESL
jgi:hypothetical protein